jgi:hypothetical protein
MQAMDACVKGNLGPISKLCMYVCMYVHTPTCFVKKYRYSQNMLSLARAGVGVGKKLSPLRGFSMSMQIIHISIYFLY